MLVPVFSSHSAQTPKASSSPAFDLQCRKSGRGKFVPLSSGPSRRFGWRRGMPCPHHTGERPCPSLSVSGGLFQPAISSPSYIPGAVSTFSPTRSEAPGLVEAAGHGICDTQRRGKSDPSPPLSCSATEHPASRAGDGAKGAGGWRRLPSI